MFGDRFYWGKTTILSLDKTKANQLIKQYTDQHYPNKVKQYLQELKTQKEQQIKKYQNVTFTTPNLMWQDQPLNKTKTFTYLEAKVYCKKLFLANKKDWRLPSLYELLQLTNYKQVMPSALKRIKNISSNQYWSKTQQHNITSNYWIVDFKYGFNDTINKNKHIYVRCVRDIPKSLKDY